MICASSSSTAVAARTELRAMQRSHVAPAGGWTWCFSSSRPASRPASRCIVRVVDSCSHQWQRAACSTRWSPRCTATSTYPCRYRALASPRFEGEEEEIRWSRSMCAAIRTLRCTAICCVRWVPGRRSCVCFRATAWRCYSKCECFFPSTP